MPLEMRHDSKWWYGIIKQNGKRKCQNLGVKIAGKRPKGLREIGDRAFERSRERAQVELERRQVEVKKRRTKEEFIQQIHEIHTGGRIESIRMDELFETWLSLPRRRKPSERYVDQAKSIFQRFCSFLTERYPTVTDMADVQRQMVETFLAAEEKRNVSPKTYNNYLILLRSSFNQLRQQAGLVENPFDGIPTKEEDTIFRKPFSAQELAEIHEASLEDDFIRPVIVAAMCTALRRGDCCLLKKTDVDLRNRFVTVKTSKTGETVQIPMFPLLYNELRQLPNSDSEFLFPEQAAMYRKNADGITWRVKQVLKRAGFYDAKSDDDTEHKGNIHGPRKNGLRDASIRDFHSFRVTWVTLALTSGVPMELVRKVTGHRTADIVLKHYFQPDRDDFRHALESKMPKLLSSAAIHKLTDRDLITLIVECRKELESMNSRTWRKQKNRVLQMINKDILKEGVSSSLTL